MEASVLIVSKDRPAELQKTLNILLTYIDLEHHEILVFLDGCKNGSDTLVKHYPQVKFEVSYETLGASKARSIIYKMAEGKILYGFDDDAHPLQDDFINITEEIYSKNQSVGIITFNEIKGIFTSDKEIPAYKKNSKEDYLVKEFLGCGFAIKKEVYNRTRGFPVWIDIYGEEVCVALETLELGYDILFTSQIAVNHRTDKQKKNISGANYFRFGKQLKNTASFYLVYYPFPLLLKKIMKLYFLNFLKYAVKDKKFLNEYLKAIGSNFRDLKNILKFRAPVSIKTLKKFNNLPNPPY